MINKTIVRYQKIWSLRTMVIEEAGVQNVIPSSKKRLKDNKGIAM